MSPRRTETGGRIDRARTVRFTFDGAAYSGHAGDTLASALLANGVSLFGRSFKYHRPRGVLSAGVDALRPGGLLVYATCSPHLAETRGVVAEVLSSRSDVEQLDARPLFTGVPELGPGPDVQLWPHRHGTDAMYAALLRRRV